MCVFPSLGVCIRVCVSVLRALVGCKRVFAASSSSITLPAPSSNLKLNLTDTTSQACSGQTAYYAGRSSRGVTPLLSE